MLKRVIREVDQLIQAQGKAIFGLLAIFILIPRFLYFLAMSDMPNRAVLLGVALGLSLVSGFVWPVCTIVITHRGLVMKSDEMLPYALHVFRQRWREYFWFVLTYIVYISIGFLVLILPAIYLMFIYLLSTVAFICEPAGVNAFGISRHLVLRQWGLTLGLLLIILMAILVVFLGLMILPQTPLMMNFTIPVVMNALTLIFYLIWTRYYLVLRERYYDEIPESVRTRPYMNRGLVAAIILLTLGLWFLILYLNL